jgi:hypothetical protein
MQDMFPGIYGFGFGHLTMLLIGGLLIYLAITKDYASRTVDPDGSASSKYSPNCQNYFSDYGNHHRRNYRSYQCCPDWFVDVR